MFIAGRFTAADGDFDWNKLAQTAQNTLDYAGGLIGTWKPQGESNVAVDAGSNTTVDNIEIGKDPDDQDKKIMGMPKYVFYPLVGVASLILIYVVVKLVKK